MQSGSVYELTGLRTDLAKAGYRLPTEGMVFFEFRRNGAQVRFTQTEFFWNA
jgi:hypothetical protein